jgi:hypothetical protein
MGKPLYTATQFIKAIEGSGGIVSTIAARVNCTWTTAKKYIDTYPTVNSAYEEEIERVIDLAEGVLIKNIQNAAKQAQAGHDVDTADVKWFLSRKAKSRGYVERQEVEHSGTVYTVDWDATDNNDQG